MQDTWSAVGCVVIETTERKATKLAMHEVCEPCKRHRAGAAHAHHGGGREAVVTVSMMARRKAELFQKFRLMMNAYCLL